MSIKLDSAKEQIDSQLIKAIHSDSSATRYHPIRIIESLKSIIGIDINNPSLKLIEWGSSYLSNQDRLSKNYFKYKIEKPKETIVLSDLKKEILLKNSGRAFKELQDLCLVSDGNQIFEYLLEFSINRHSRMISFIWSAYRANLFLNNKYSYQLLYLCVKNLIFHEDYLQEKSIFQIENSFIIESIKKTPLVRENKINKKLSSFTLEFLSSYNKDIKFPINVMKEGRVAILNYLNNLNSDKITKEMILFLDTCRMAIKDSDIKNHQIIGNVINLVIEDKLYD